MAAPTAHCRVFYTVACQQGDIGRAAPNIDDDRPEFALLRRKRGLTRGQLLERYLRLRSPLY